MKKSALLLPVLFLILLSCSGEGGYRSNNQDVIELRCEPLDTVRVAIIGLGMRGAEAVYRLTFIDRVKIVAVCDVVPEEN